MTSVLIAEQEALPCAEIRAALERLWPALEIAAIVHEGHAARQVIEHLRPQVLFLDMQLPGLGGLELARLAGQRAHIVFIAAVDGHAVPAFDAGAIDYLLKPLDPARLARAIRRVKARWDQAPADDPEPLIGRARLAPPTGPLRWISAMQGREIRLLPVEDVCYFRADHKYIVVVTAEDEALISTPLKELLAKLDPEMFWQVHRGTVVNLHAVRSISRGADGRLSLHLKQRPESLAVGNPYASRFRHM